MLLNCWVYHVHKAYSKHTHTQTVLPHSLMMQQALVGGPGPPHYQSFTITLRHLVQLLWMSDHPDTETSTWQQTTLTKDIHVPSRIQTHNPSKYKTIMIHHIQQQMQCNDDYWRTCYSKIWAYISVDNLDNHSEHSNFWKEHRMGSNILVEVCTTHT
jgi:hypothetical protein